MGGSPSPESQFVFRPSGALTGRSVSLVLSNSENRHTITVTGATGAINVQ
jgi:hypothetical protein